MRYMLMFYETEADVDQGRASGPANAYWGAWNAYVGAVQASGVMIEGNGLQPPETATTVRMREGRRQVQDGPFADSKEHLGGYFVIDVPSLDDALDGAARSPAATTEVRPVLPRGTMEA